MKNRIEEEMIETMTACGIDHMTVERHRDAVLAKKKLIEFYSCKGKPNYYKKYYYMEKLASYGHIPAMKTLMFMRQDGVGCDRTLERKQEGLGDKNNKRVIQIDIENVESKLIFTHSSEYNTIKKTLEQAAIEDIDLRGAYLVGIGVRDADLECAEFRGANFISANFKGTNFRDANFRESDCRYSDFRETKCIGVDFRCSNLRDANFNRADFRDADLRGADLRGAKYTKKQIDSAITDETTIFYGCKDD